jgi:hypothetical protein
MVRQPFQASALNSRNFLLALIAMVRIIAFQHIALDQRPQTQFDALLILHRQGQSKEGFLALTGMRAGTAYDLVAYDTTEMLLDQILIARALDAVLQPIHQQIAELIDVHLLKHVRGIPI